MLLYLNLVQLEESQGGCDQEHPIFLNVDDSFQAEDLPGENDGQIDPHEFGHVAQIFPDATPGDFVVATGNETAAAETN